MKILNSKYYVPMGTPISVCFTVNDNTVGIDTLTERSMVVEWSKVADSIFYITENDEILYMINIKYCGVCERP